jgi:aspartyl-tRNA(Asn)/glutamyl-tRNA(Gln) amidotransferase subunit A
MDAINTYGSVISRVEGGTIHAEWMRGRPQDYATHLSARLYSGYAVPASYYLEAISRRGPILKAIGRDVFGACNVFLSPTIRTKVPTLASTDVDAGNPGAAEAFNFCSINTRPINYMGLPCVSVPCGFDSGGLPIGIQIAGRPFGEGRVLKVADAFQRDTDWHARRPKAAG